ncbi:hypothetical protein C2W62_07730 [Candidatus Entotheonella serta]|nr:hypothetical protein C2W62_07730 [Candidatus Entotheonella serta]
MRLALVELSHAHQASLFMTLLAGFALLLQRYSGQDDVVIGSAIANRQDTALESLIGFFVNSLALRVQPDAHASFTDLLAQVRATTLSAYQHQDVPFEQVVDALSPERSLSYSPLFQVVFALQNAPMEPLQLTELTQEPLMGEELQVRFDVEVHAIERDGALDVLWLYNRDLFDPDRIERMAHHFNTLLEAVVARPNAPLHQLSLLDTTERVRLLEDFNATPALISAATLPELFEQQVEATPNATAVVFEQYSLSYAELNARANQLAHYLIAQGVDPETVVGVCLERSIDLIVSLLGIFKAGVAYLPLDPDYPQARLQLMLDDAHPQLVLSQSSLLQPYRQRYCRAWTLLPYPAYKRWLLPVRHVPGSSWSAGRRGGVCSMPMGRLNRQYVPP